MRNNGSDQREIQTPSKGQTLSELTSGAGVEVEPFTNMSAVELELFMNEKVLIEVMKTSATDKGAINPILPSVGGINMPIFRGVPTYVKRKYVEVLVWSHNVGYEQVVNPLSLDQFTMKKVATPSYPFAVIEDTKKGFAWKKDLEEKLAAQV